MMISSSLNSNVSQRMEFFGLLRCLGATRHQVLRFVRREALQWCITAMPIGIGLSIVVVWGLCAVMRQLSTVWFGYMPIWGISHRKNYLRQKHSETEVLFNVFKDVDYEIYRKLIEPNGTAASGH